MNVPWDSLFSAESWFTSRPVKPTFTVVPETLSIFNVPAVAILAGYGGLFRSSPLVPNTYPDASVVCDRPVFEGDAFALDEGAHPG